MKFAFVAKCVNGVSTVQGLFRCQIRMQINDLLSRCVALRTLLGNLFKMCQNMLSVLNCEH